jgi:hypothetical protein
VHYKKKKKKAYIIEELYLSELCNIKFNLSKCQIPREEKQSLNGTGNQNHFEFFSIICNHFYIHYFERQHLFSKIFVKLVTDPVVVLILKRIDRTGKEVLRR